MTRPTLLGDEGRRALDDQEPDLFPATVRPAFLGLLWVALIVLSIAATALLVTLGGRLR